MHRIQVQLKSFSAAHRLGNHYSGTCSNLHGHNYDISVILGSKELNEFGFVMDFHRVKELCNDWIKKYWDHVVFLNKKDVTLFEFLKQEKQKYFLLPQNQLTSAENLAKYAFTELTKIITQENQQIELLQVEIWETKDCKAIYAKY